MGGTLFALLESAISTGVFPGAAYACGRLPEPKEFQGVAGRLTYCPESAEVTHQTLYDLASLSKVVGTTTMAMILYDKGKLHLDQPVSEITPEFGQNGKDNITLRNLLVHDSGLIAFRPYNETCKTPEEVWEAICKESLTYPTGTKSIYSDLSMITLQKVMEKLSGASLDAFLDRQVWKRLGMRDTLYKPGIGNKKCAPTEPVEPWRAELRRLRKESPKDHWIQGEVHDPTATVLGGVAGHAGLFSTAIDLARFALFMLREGEDLIKPETIKLFTKKDSDLSTRALGWDTKSPDGYTSAGSMFGPSSFGHTGFTGTSIWIDPDAKMYSVLLTNRVHPTASNTKIIQFRPEFNDAVATAILGS